MKQGLSEVVFILDRSGSMSGLECDTIGGFNAMLKKQKKEKGDALITTVLFDDRCEILHDRIHVQGIKPITDKEYYVQGTTALLDAIGKTIIKIGNAHKNTIEEERPEHVMFVITTDGMENASREFRYDKIKQMIEHQKSKYQWEFIFLGANIDALETAQRFGIEKERATNYHADGEGTALNFEIISETLSNLRANKAISSDWKSRIDENFNTRKSK